MRDAVPCEMPGRREKRAPGHAAVWIRVAGEWWPGSIHAWYQLDDARWAVWLQHEDPDGSPWARWGGFVFDPEVIRPRHDETRPS